VIIPKKSAARAEAKARLVHFSLQTVFLLSVAFCASRVQSPSSFTREANRLLEMRTGAALHTRCIFTTGSGHSVSRRVQVRTVAASHQSQRTCGACGQRRTGQSIDNGQTPKNGVKGGHQPAKSRSFRRCQSWILLRYAKGEYIAMRSRMTGARQRLAAGCPLHCWPSSICSQYRILQDNILKYPYIIRWSDSIRWIVALANKSVLVGHAQRPSTLASVDA
jgi:hypothetical protein